MNSKLSIKQQIRAEAIRLGFSACGFAKAEHVSEEEERHLRNWLEKGYYADMAYMNNYLDKRLDPRLLMPGLKTIVSVALNYAPAKRIPEGEPQIADYALGQDYHDVVKKKLFQLAAFTNSLIDEELTFRAFVDTAPVLERYWAVQAGIGWQGRNQQLIIPHAGSEFFLGELFIDIELEPDKKIEPRCGKCHKCIDACPTGALGHSDPLPTVGQVTENFNAELCLSYQTIENRKELSDNAKKAMGDTFYGCDRCQRACPWNKFATPNNTPELQPKEELLQMTKDKWKNLTVEDYRRIFKGSAVKRAKYDGLMRNIDNL